MPRFIGRLTILDGDSSLDGTPLAKAPLSGDPFGNATTFLRQDRGLTGGIRVFVDGTPGRIGDVDVIIITEAGRVLPSVVGAGGTLRAMFATAKGGTLVTRLVTAGGKSGAKKGASKKSGGRKGGKKAGASAKSSKGKSTRKQNRS